MKINKFLTRQAVRDNHNAGLGFSKTIPFMYVLDYRIGVGIVGAGVIWLASTISGINAPTSAKTTAATETPPVDEAVTTTSTATTPVGTRVDP